MTQIEKLKEENIEEVSNMLKDCYRWCAVRYDYGHGQLDFMLKERASIEHVRNIYDKHICFIAFNDTDIIGMISVRENEIDKLYVTPSSHQKGIGSLLFRKAEDCIRDSGFDSVFLGTIHKDVVPFYEKQGMQPDGIKICQTGGFIGQKVSLLRKSIK